MPICVSEALTEISPEYPLLGFAHNEKNSKCHPDVLTEGCDFHSVILLCVSLFLQGDLLPFDYQKEEIAINAKSQTGSDSVADL